MRETDAAVPSGNEQRNGLFLINKGAHVAQEERSYKRLKDAGYSDPNQKRSLVESRKAAAAFFTWHQFFFVSLLSLPNGALLSHTHTQRLA